MGHSRLSSAAALGVVLSMLVGCSDIGDPIISPVEHGNFVLYVTNQSFAVDPVDVRVYIDGQRAVDQKFASLAGHNFVRFEFQIEEGKHTLRMASSHVSDVQSADFVISSTPYAVVEFWSSQSTTFEAGGDPPHFMVHFFSSQPSWE
jgi:hypothetical protein